MSKVLGHSLPQVTASVYAHAIGGLGPGKDGGGSRKLTWCGRPDV